MDKIKHRGLLESMRLETTSPSEIARFTMPSHLIQRAVIIALVRDFIAQRRVFIEQQARSRLKKFRDFWHHR
jgi:hypothetical protein